MKVLILVVMVFTVAAAQDLPIGAVQPAPEAFADVPADHWANEAVRLLLQQGICLLYTSPSPRDS